MEHIGGRSGHSNVCSIVSSAVRQSQVVSPVLIPHFTKDTLQQPVRVRNLFKHLRLGQHSSLQ